MPGIVAILATGNPDAVSGKARDGARPVRLFAKRFEGLFETVGLNDRQRRERMSELMQESLSTLDPAKKDRLRENLDQAPISVAVTALRTLLD